MNTYVKFGLLSAVVVGALGWLAVGGIQETQTYFKTIPELRAWATRPRSSGCASADSSSRARSLMGHDVHFTLVENEGGTGEGRPSGGGL